MNLQAAYSREDFLVFLRDYLPDFSKDVRGADKTGLRVTQEITYLGESQDLNLSIFELQHKSSIDARVSLSKDGFRLMKNHQLNKALIVYLPKESVDWRLSLLTATLGTDEKGNATKELSNPKRLSYFLGPNAKINTPKRFLLDPGKVKSFDELLDRFNVEIVTKEFFKQYRNLFEKLLEYLKKDFAFQAFAGQNGVDTTSFAKKLLGQIVFIYFLQRKGWLGARKGEKISDGDRHFLRNLFETSRNENLDFFNFYLEPLFYDALNKPTNKPASFYRDYFECQIPFLNGGLFEPIQYYDWQNNHLNIPNKIFSNSEEDGILDIFDLYNFTIDESDPTDQEVSVDPEMLGKVFENLIEENLRKGKGTYYTPREIVHYMCQESLSNYLKSKVSGIDLNIDSLIHFGEYSDLESSGIIALTQEQSLNLDEALRSIKVVDPACGSGAFLVGVLHEIVKARSLLAQFNEKKTSEYELKKESIQNCIYGVDIDPGAIEIAKLRLWLSLVVDHELDDIEPLPNLDYKLMVGNSLIEKFDENLLNQTTDKDKNKLIELLLHLKSSYFEESDSTRKKEYREQINDILRLLINYSNEAERKKIWEALLAKKNQMKLFDFDAKQQSFANIDRNKHLKRLTELEDLDETSHFEWHLNFSEVFEKGGFDIVIANPPYVGEKNNKTIFRTLRKGGLCNYYQDKMDLFYFFFHLALNLGKEKTQIAFITTNYYLTATGARKLRNDLRERAKFKNFINFNELKIFESAKGQHSMITILEKNKLNYDYETNIIWVKRLGYANQDLLTKLLYGKSEDASYYTVSRFNLFDGQQDYIRIEEANNEIRLAVNRILNKFKTVDNYLYDCCNINKGVYTGAETLTKSNRLKYSLLNHDVGDGIFVLTNSELSSLMLSSFEKGIIKPFFKNSDISSYFTSLGNRLNLINFTYTSRQMLDAYPNLQNHLLKFEKLLVDRPLTGTLQSAMDNGYWYVLSTSRRVNMEGAKIVAPYRSKYNTFGYNEVPWYAGSDVYYITEKDSAIQLKYVLAILNSKLCYLWLYNKGKKKGEVLELTGQPLEEIPIKRISREEQESFIKIVNKILNITSLNNYLEKYSYKKEVDDYKRKIDCMVYRLYGLTKEEIKIVEEQ